MTAAALARLDPVFKKTGSVHAGNSSGITDGAAAIVVLSESAVKRLGVKPLARLVAYAEAGVDPKVMGIGPVPAVRALLERTKVPPASIDLWELNEAFAAQVIACNRELKIDEEKLNVDGGAIALGHPIGATGCRILVTLLHSLAERNLKRGVATLCISRRPGPGGAGGARVMPPVGPRGGRRALTLLAAGTVGLALAGPVAAKDEKPAWTQDLEFLLSELPGKARALLAEKKIDWAKATKDLKAEAKKVKDDAAFVRLVNRILARLKDGHAGITKLAPDLEAAWKAAQEAEAKGRRFTGPRVHVAPAGERVLVVEAFGPAAEQHGVRVGMEVLTIDDAPAREWLTKRAAAMSDEQGYSTSQAALHAAGHWGLAGWEGISVSFTLRAGKEKKQVTIPRQGGPNFAPAGPVIPPAGLASVGRQSYGKTAAGFGYIHLRDVPETLPAQLDQMLAAIGDVPGLILDMRANGGGGCDHAAVFGRFVAQGARWRQSRARAPRRTRAPWW